MMNNTTNDNVPTVWLVYDHPIELPNYFVARRFDIDAGAITASWEGVCHESLEALRNVLRGMGKRPIPIAIPQDPSENIIETWA